MIPSYLDAAVILGNRKTKKLANNTYLRKDGDNYVIRLHETDIVTIRPAECTEYVLNTGGWFTMTTKGRITDYSPAQVFSKSGVWYVKCATGKVFLYEDGMIINQCGVVLSDLKTVEAATPHLKQLNKKVKEYVTGYVKHVEEHGLEAPSGGDCWNCLFGLQAPKMATGSLDHVFAHVLEKYYVPSFYVLALMLKYKTEDVSRYYHFPYFRSSEHVKQVLMWFFNRYRVEMLRLIMDSDPAYIKELENLVNEVDS